MCREMIKLMFDLTSLTYLHLDFTELRVHGSFSTENGITPGLCEFRHCSGVQSRSDGV